MSAWLFFTNLLAGASTVTLTVDGSTIRAADGSLLDADFAMSMMSMPGSKLSSTFTTVNQVPVAGTTITGAIADPGPDFKPMTRDDVRNGPDGVLGTADDVYLLPIAHVEIYVAGHPDQAVYTDDQGTFTLTSVPTGDVKLVINGNTATNAPDGFFFPEMVMDLTDVKPGIANTVMGSMGTPESQIANTANLGVYLPRLQTSILQPISDTEVTHITADAISAPNLTPEQRQYLTLDIQPGSLIGYDGKPVTNGNVGISVVPPAIVNDMLPSGLLQHAFDITIQATGVATFSKPAVLTLPNLMGGAPGTQVPFLSFDHTTGRLNFEGTMTVSADGLYVRADPGTGVTHPGWHCDSPPGSDEKCPPPPPPCDPAKVSQCVQQATAIENWSLDAVNRGRAQEIDS
jgi:hypothetical protein